MAGRGRGRGRGRGSQMSFDYNQLGFGGGENLPGPVLQPPPTFPPLEHKPVPLKWTPETEYMVALKRDFVEYLQSIRQNNDSSSAIERFSDKYQVMSSDPKECWESQMYWDAMPSELNPKERKRKSTKRKSDKSSSTSPKKPNIDITRRLDELAKLEDKDEEESEEVKDTEEKDQDEDNDKDNIEEEDEDEEMDDGTDYVNNYFDNGEGYFDDEDDNLDDGPIY